MDKMNCLINKVLDFQLSTGTFTGHSGSVSGYDQMTFMPYLIIPFLMVLIAGLYLIDQYRRKTSV
ncbi:hypothetical protein [Chitinophaga barathri]|uniref:Uncharacterized protein n=1 Tax=Chitinophaga barathri TaxID=1647451 RepID=A0A3N4MEX0_9BACT|nr:hypothetical protein [Chitinophaga barathri]RPD40207.1 hypothetical protein EG028_16280 [Chitinophaga barathri]